VDSFFGWVLKVSKRYNLKKKRSKIFLQGAPSSSYSPHMTQLPAGKCLPHYTEFISCQSSFKKYTSTKEQTKKKIQLMSQLQQLLNSITIKIGIVKDNDLGIETNLHN
jgi:hypothetical protein